MEAYLDNSATTKPYDEVIDVMAFTMKNNYGNPSSAHSLGLSAEKTLNESRELLARTINASKEEIIFTSGGSESNNFLIRGFATQGGHIITTKIEHPSVLEICRELEHQGTRVTYLDVDNSGRISIEKLRNNICKETQLISIMHVNNEIGIIQDIEAIGKAIKEESSRAKFHVDAVQSYGKFNIDVKKCNIDLLSISGHKIHGPRGIGFACIRKGLVIRPLIYGGGQEKGYRSGTENLAAIVGLAKASEIMYSQKAENYNKVKGLKAYFTDKLREIENIKVISKLQDYYSPYILSVSFKGVKSEVLLHSLEEKNIYVSTGSACSSKDEKLSNVLTAIGLNVEEVKGTIRFSFSEQNTLEDIDYTIENLIESLKFLRRI